MKLNYLVERPIVVTNSSISWLHLPRSLRSRAGFSIIRMMKRRACVRSMAKRIPTDIISIFALLCTHVTFQYSFTTFFFRNNKSCWKYQKKRKNCTITNTVKTKHCLISFHSDSEACYCMRKAEINIRQKKKQENVSYMILSLPWGGTEENWNQRINPERGKVQVDAKPKKTAILSIKGSPHTDTNNN